MISGKAIKYADDNINTDVIMNSTFVAQFGFDREQLGKYCLVNYDPDFPQKAGKGDILVAHANFGCGSSKPAALALLGAGIESVIAYSFSRLFFRSAINLGLLPIESREISDGVSDGDKLEIDVEKKAVRNLTSGREFLFPSYPPFVWEIISCGGIVEWMNKYGGRLKK